jgi:hypothetical protein
MPANRRIVLNLAEFRSIVAGQPLAFKINTQRVEISIAPIAWVDLIRAILDGMKPKGAREDAPPDPPEAREFLSRSTRR